jgi:hypothetical protein
MGEVKGCGGGEGLWGRWREVVDSSEDLEDERGSKEPMDRRVPEKKTDHFANTG